MIFSYIFIAILIILSLVIQGHSSFDVLRIAGVKPDLLFIIVIYIAYSFNSFMGAIIGFISGLLHDAVSLSPLGLLTFPKMALGFIIGLFGRSVIKSNILTIILMVFISSIAKGIITLFLCYIFHQATISTVVSVILPEAFYNAILAPPLFFMFDKVFEKELKDEDNQ